MHATTIDSTLTVFKFFSMDHTPPRVPTLPLQKPFQLLMELGNLCYYLPSRAPEAPSNMAVMMYIRHTIDFKTFTARAEEWLWTKNATWVATTIQLEHAKDLCWFVYSTKNTNCNDLGVALTKLLGKTVGLQFKTIQTGPPHKPIASAVHLLVDEADTTHIMKQLHDIYSKNRMNNHATDYPLGQCLLLAPMAKGLNNNNMTSLQQLKAKQASFCNQIIMVTTRVIRDLDINAMFVMAEGNHQWSLQGLLMQVAHPTIDTCTFFQAIDNYSAGQGIAFTMLPSAVNFGRNAILGLIPFTRWLLEPVYGKWQSYNLDLAFFPEALQEMASATWDEQNNCIEQKEGNLLGRALKDLDIYNLWPKQEANPTATVLVDMMGTALQENKVNQSIPNNTGNTTHSMRHIQQQDNDSLTNSIQSQNTMFTQAIHQMDTLAECQAAFENNTQSALETIMDQLAELTCQNRKCQHNRNYAGAQDYDEDDSWTRVTANDSMEEDIGETE